MKMNIAKIIEETNRLYLYIPTDYEMMLKCHPEIVDRIANGVGSETSWTYHITPDTNWFMNINPTSHAHDWMYTFPLVFQTTAAGMAWKRLADHCFALNHRLQIAAASKMLYLPRMQRAEEYDFALQAGGDVAFWEDKPLPSYYFLYFDKAPGHNADRFAKLTEIQTLINKSLQIRSTEDLIPLRLFNREQRNVPQLSSIAKVIGKTINLSKIDRLMS